MRTIAIILICLVLGAPGFAQGPAPAPPGVSVSFSNVPLRQAIEVLFNYSNAGFVLDPGIDQSPYDRINVSLNLVNADFDQALSTLLDRTGLAWTLEDGQYRIAPSSSQQARPAGVQMVMASELQNADLATVNLPAMPVKEALNTVWPRSPWTFRDDLGRTPMPGAKFYQFPRQMAGATVVAAAGLIPPTGSERMIAFKGRANLADMFQWDPGRQLGIQAPGSAPTAPSGQAQRFGFNQQNASNATLSSAGVAISAYRLRTGDTWVFTIMANRALDTDVLEKLFGLSGKAYVMGDLAQRPQVQNYYLKSATSEEKASAEVPNQVIIRGPKLISAQLRNVTLDQALDSLLPAAGLRYRKMGPPNSLTYVIEVPPLIPQ